MERLGDEPNITGTDRPVPSLNPFAEGAEPTEQAMHPKHGMLTKHPAASSRGEVHLGRDAAASDDSETTHEAREYHNADHDEDQPVSSSSEAEFDEPRDLVSDPRATGKEPKDFPGMSPNPFSGAS